MTPVIEPIAVITTGGTIDKVYFDALSEYRVGDSVIQRLLAMANVSLPYRLIALLRKDSLDLTNEDRALIASTVAALPERRVVVTHGTDTMTQSAEALAGGNGKTVVFTGALAPARFAESDAFFNLGMAVAAVQCLSSGVYIAMNGQVFEAGQVRKDRSAGRFVALQS